MTKMFLAQADATSSTLISYGYPQFASARVSSWAADALDEAMRMMYPTVATPDPWVRVGSERN
jgi:hypothetical protein